MQASGSQLDSLLLASCVGYSPSPGVLPCFLFFSLCNSFYTDYVGSYSPVSALKDVQVTEAVGYTQEECGVSPSPTHPEMIIHRHESAAFEVLQLSLS